MSPRRSNRRPEARAGVALALLLVGPWFPRSSLGALANSGASQGSSQFRHRIRRTPTIELIGGIPPPRFVWMARQQTSLSRRVLRTREVRPHRGDERVDV